MPEGHSIHRHARTQRAALAGQLIETGSPQGRFALGAQRLNGRMLLTVDAHGKHLFYRWEGDEILHIHLGLFGKFRLYKSDPAPPSENTRLTMQGDQTTVYLAGPTVCELVDPVEEEAIRNRLGPDPLGNSSPGSNLGEFASNLSRRRVPIGAALLDQRVIAGVGNIYRAEALFRTGIDPHVPAGRLSEEAIETLWSECASLLERGVKDGRIITVDPGDVGARRRSDLRSEERLYVYKRQGEPCRRCETPVAVTEMANRALWWCPTCQPSGFGS